MVKKRIVWSKEAQLDFKAILEFYNERNGRNTYSIKLANQLINIIEKLQINNFLGLKTSDSQYVF